MKKLTMTVLYQDLFSLHGDRGNIWAFERAARALGLTLEIKRADSFSDKPDLKNTDILLCSSCELRVAEKAAEALRKYRDELQEYIERGGVVVCTGHSLAVFAKKTLRRDKSEFSGLGLVDATLSELRAVYSNDAICETDTFGVPLRIVGGQVQMAKVFLGGDAEPLGRNLYGYGNCKGEFEGLRYKNFIASNYQGPVFVKNPLFACEILKIPAKSKKIMYNEVSENDFALERDANAKIEAFTALKAAKYDRTRLNNEEKPSL